MKLFFLACTLLNLSGCAPGEETKESPDTGKTKDTEDSNAPNNVAPYAQSDAIVSHISALLPFFVWKQSSHLGFLDNPDPCPSRSATEDGEGLIVTGGCTDQKGTRYEGLFEISNAKTGNALVYNFSHFSMTHDAFFLAMNDELHHDLENKILSANLQVDMADYSRNLTVQAFFSDYILNGVLDAGEVLGGRTGSFVSEGSISITDVDDFLFTGTFENREKCTLEIDEMELIFTGERGRLIFTESANSCDSCTEWSDDSNSGKICVQ
jgi:hypothetical protein